MSGSPETGTKPGRYEIRSKIGEGGMGEVYLAYDPKLNRDVAEGLAAAREPAVIHRDGNDD